MHSFIKVMKHETNSYIFSDMKPYSPLEVNRRFRRTCRPYLLDTSFMLVACLAFLRP
jgi:hypothetical protein